MYNKLPNCLNLHFQCPFPKDIFLAFLSRFPKISLPVWSYATFVSIVLLITSHRIRPYIFCEAGHAIPGFFQGIQDSDGQKEFKILAWNFEFTDSPSDDFRKAEYFFYQVFQRQIILGHCNRIAWFTRIKFISVYSAFLLTITVSFENVASLLL